jgi:hypothetical protein
MIRLDEIVIPSPPNTSIPLGSPEGRSSNATLVVNGYAYTLMLSNYDGQASLNASIQRAAQVLVYQKLSELDAYRDQLMRLHESLNQAQRQIQANQVPIKVPGEKHAKAGLRVWQRADGDYGFEMPLVYQPQFIVVYCQTMRLAEGQFRPIYLSAVMRYNLPSKMAVGHSLFYLATGQQFIHYHTSGGQDCMGDMEIDIKTYDEVLAHFAEWQAQLNIINTNSLGLQDPPNLPMYRNLLVVNADNKEVAWTTQAVTEEIERSEVRANQVF